LARLATNFKNAGNGGFFNVFEVPQMENGWENGSWKPETGFIHPCVLLGSRGEVRQAGPSEELTASTV
jgi:hypothetical protein